MLLEYLLYTILYICCFIVVHYCFVHWKTFLMVVSRLLCAFFLWSIFYVAMEMEKHNMWSTLWEAYETHKHRFEL